MNLLIQPLDVVESNSMTSSLISRTQKLSITENDSAHATTSCSTSSSRRTTTGQQQQNNSLLQRDDSIPRSMQDSCKAVDISSFEISPLGIIQQSARRGIVIDSISEVLEQKEEEVIVVALKGK